MSQHLLPRHPPPLPGLLLFTSSHLVYHQVSAACLQHHKEKEASTWAPLQLLAPHHLLLLLLLLLLIYSLTLPAVSCHLEQNSCLPARHSIYIYIYIYIEREREKATCKISVTRSAFLDFDISNPNQR